MHLFFSSFFLTSLLLLWSNTRASFVGICHFLGGNCQVPGALFSLENDAVENVYYLFIYLFMLIIVIIPYGITPLCPLAPPKLHKSESSFLAEEQKLMRK